MDGKDKRCDVRMPEIGLGSAHILVSAWFVEPGAEVVQGDRLLQVVAGEVSIDLPAPASGRLTHQFVVEEEVVQAGQLLASIVTP